MFKKLKELLLQYKINGDGSQHMYPRHFVDIFREEIKEFKRIRFWID